MRHPVFKSIRKELNCENENEHPVEINSEKRNEHPVETNCNEHTVDQRKIVEYQEESKI